MLLLFMRLSEICCSCASSGLSLQWLRLGSAFDEAALLYDTTMGVLGEDRSLSARGGAFSDAFSSWAVQGYRLGTGR